MKKGNNGLDLRSQNTFLLPKANTVHYGHGSLKYLGCKIWNIIPNEMKLCESVETFKSAIKKWIPNKCSCRLCKPYIARIGYL